MKKKKSRFFYSIFIPVLSVGVLLVIFFSMYVYKDTYNNVFDNVVDEKSSFVRQVKSNLEQKVQAIEYGFSTYSSSSEFERIVSQPLDFHNFEEVRQVTSDLAYIGIMGVENTDYSLVSLSQNWQIKTGNLSTLSEKEVAEYKNLMNSYSDDLVWTPMDGKIRMMISLPIFSQNRNSIGIADINDQVIKNLIADSEDEMFSIYDSNGKALFENASSLKKDILEKISAQKDRAYGYVEDDDNNLYVYSQSSYNNWTYISRIKKSVIQHATSRLKWGLVIISTLAVILIWFCASLIAGKSTKPIREIKSRLDLSASDSKNSSQGEIKEILSGIENIISKNEDLSLRVTKQKPELEQLFLLNLFRNRIDSSDIPRRMAQFNYSNIDKRYLTMLIQIDDLGGRDESAVDIFLISIEKLVEDIIPEVNRMRPIVLNAETQASILLFDQEDSSWKQEVLTYCNQIQEAANKYLKVKVSIGISKDYLQLSESKKAVDEAKEALHFRINLGSESVIFYDEIASQFSETSPLKYPREEEEQLLDAIRGGKNAELDEAYDKVIKKIFMENSNPLAIETTILQLTNNIMQLGQLLGADYEVFQHNRHIYAEILSTDDPRKLKNLIYNSLIVPIVDTFQDRTDRELKTLSEKITRIVHQQYDEDISLESIADTLHYNPNYLSSVFKKEFGSNFGDYLQNYRLEMAKKWLIETNMTVKEISQRLQYNNPQNFIRFFKKKENKTPGEYRKENAKY